MGFDLNSIKRGVEHKAPRIVLLGVEKIGKSTFASGADNPIVLPIKGEEGVDDLDVAKFPRAETFDDVLQAVSTLITESTILRRSSSTARRRLSRSSGRSFATKTTATASRKSAVDTAKATLKRPTSGAI